MDKEKKKLFGEFKPIGNLSPKKENKFIFMAMMVIVLIGLILIIKAL